MFHLAARNRQVFFTSKCVLYYIYINDNINNFSCRTGQQHCRGGLIESSVRFEWNTFYLYFYFSTSTHNFQSAVNRVQVFDSNGIFVKEFGQYGNGEGEFDCLAGVAVNRIGQYIIADRYNHRIQVLDPQGRFLRSFGTQGIADGKFNYPWGVTTDALGFIYVCDKENHRVQVCCRVNCSIDFVHQLLLPFVGLSIRWHICW